jgi:hypothetical protein
MNTENFILISIHFFIINFLILKILEFKIWEK